MNIPLVTEDCRVLGGFPAIAGPWLILWKALERHAHPHGPDIRPVRAALSGRRHLVQRHTAERIC